MCRTCSAEKGPSYFRGPTQVLKTFMRSKLPISKNKENISEYTSQKNALTKIEVEIL